MSTQTLKAEFKAALSEAEALKSKQDRTEDDAVRFKMLAEEVLPQLRGRIETQESIDNFSLDSYADMTQKSSGTPYSRPVGHAHIGADGSIEDEGDGALTDAQYKAVMEPAYKRAFKTYMRLGEQKTKETRPAVFKTLVAGLDEYAGITIPPDWLDKVITRTAAPTVVQDLVTSFTTSSNRLLMLRETYKDPNGLDIRTSPIQGQWTGEGGNPDESPVPGLGEVSIPIHEHMGKLSMSNTLLEDTGFPLESWIGGKVQEWLRWHYEYHVLNGTGVGQPLGLWTNAGQPQGLGQMGFVTTNTVGAIDPDTIKGMEYEILPQYQGDAVWLMNQRTAKAVSLLKDDQKQYLFQRGELPHNTIVNANPKLLAGYPVIVSQYLPDIATGACPAFFGSLKGYYKVSRIGMTVRVLNEIEALKNRRVYAFRLRWGGMPVEDPYGKFVKIK